MNKCTICPARGNLAKCKDRECSYHGLWIVQELKLLNANLKQASTQNAFNTKWLINIIDGCHKILCPGQKGTWQDRAMQIRETVTLLSILGKKVDTSIRHYPDACDCRQGEKPASRFNSGRI